MFYPHFTLWDLERKLNTQNTHCCLVYELIAMSLQWNVIGVFVIRACHTLQDMFFIIITLSSSLHTRWSYKNHKFHFSCFRYCI
jgi:hypothetical protein